MVSGLFADIPGVKDGRRSSAGLFDDVGADPLAGVDWNGLMDPASAKAVIDKLPESSRQRARDVWADHVVARDRQGGGTFQRIDDAVRRAASNVPGVGTWADELNAVTASMFGNDYDMAHAYERAKDRAVNAAETTKLGRLPIVGDVTTGGLEKAAGTIAGAVALPFARVVEGGGAGATALNVGLNAGAYGTVQGAGEGTSVDERASNAAKTGALSTAAGFGIGGVLGKITGKGTPAAIADREAANATAEAAQRVGVDLPNVAAGTPNSAKMTVGAVLKEIPVVGAPIVHAADKAAGQMTDAAGRIAGKYAENATPLSAGEAAKAGLTDWIKRGSADTIDGLYEGVRRMVPAAATRPLAATRKVAADLAADDAAAATTVNAKAIGVIREAIERPDGLTYQGMTQLRTHVGNMLDDALLPEAGTVKPALKRIYGALTDDLRDTVRVLGGREAEKSWTQANNATRIIEHKREALAKLIGVDGKAAPESIVDRIVTMAGSKSSADIKTLLKARNVLPADAWDQVSAAAIGRLGRNAADEFSPAIFLTKYSGLSNNGRNVLFASGGRGALKSELDALSKTIGAFKNLQRLGNPSGSGRVVAGVGAILTGTLSPVTLPFIAMKGIAGRVMAQALAKPVTVKEINRFSKRLYEALESDTGQAALRFATLTLAKVISDATGADEKQVAESISRDTKALFQPVNYGLPSVPAPSSPVPSSKAQAAPEPTVTNRGMVLPLAEMSDGSVQPALPGFIAEPYEAFKRSLANFDPAKPIDEATVRDGLIAGSAALPLTRFSAPRGAVASAQAAPAAVREAVPVEAAPVAKDAVVPASAQAATREPVRIVTPDQSMEITAQPELVELSSLKEAAGRFQPRDRSRAEYMQEARERAARLDPAQLGASRVSDSGAPIVLADGTVISGNGRTMSIEEVYKNPAMRAQADAYRASLGPEAANMSEPVLVMRAQGLGGDEASRFADLSNRGRIASMSATERAQRDAKAMSDIIGLYQGGDFESPANASFFKAFMDKVPTRTERAALSKDGQLTQEGAQRMRNAVLASAYDDAPTLARMLESTDDNIRNITGALTDAAPKFAQLKADITSGAVMADMDATPSITSAVKLIADLRSRRVRPSDFFAQRDAFGGTDPITEAWVRAFYNEDLGRPISREKMTAVLNAYADEAAKHRPGGLFPDETTAKDVLNVAERAKTADDGPTLFGSNQGHGASLPDGGAEVSGREIAGRVPGPDDAGTAAPLNSPEARYINRMRAGGSTKTDAELRADFNARKSEQLAKVDAQKRRRKSGGA